MSDRLARFVAAGSSRQTVLVNPAHVRIIVGSSDNRDRTVSIRFGSHEQDTVMVECSLQEAAKRLGFDIGNSPDADMS